MTDARGQPLAMLVSGANRHDSIFFEDLIDAMQLVGGLQGMPRKRADTLHADNGYDYVNCHKALRQQDLQSRIARRGVERRERLGKHRRVMERTHAWFAGFGKVRIRFERQLGTHLALLKVACAIICLRFVEQYR